jgi:hypothetical protein
MWSIRTMDAFARRRAVRTPAAAFAACFAGALAFGADPELEVCPGEPFGAARVRFTVAEPSGLPLASARFNLGGDHRRVLYPVFIPDAVPAGADGPVGSPGGFEVLFLFRGLGSFRLTALSNLDQSPYREFRAAIDPAASGQGSGGGDRRRALLSRWWRHYAALLRDARVRDAYHPVIESYLAWHLPRALQLGGAADPFLEPPSADLASRPLQAFGDVQDLADLLIGSESIRVAMQRDTLLETSGDAAVADRPLPAPLALPAVEIPAAGVGLEIEAIAGVAPAECLYVRFPRFSGFRRLRGRLERLGGEVHDLYLGRALDAKVRERLETQLALRETELSRLFGDLVIGEVALIASDTFVREGSALGFIFEIKNAPLFEAAIGKLRQEVFEVSKGWGGEPASEREVESGAGAVRLLATPDHRVRSFYAVAGRYHLVSNSKRLATRFLECARAGDKSSLAHDPGFQHGRELHRLGGDEDAFVFISDPFIRELVGPAYRVEMTRRTRARAELELIEAARAVALAETGEEFRLLDLIAAGYLPRGVLRHPDGASYADAPGGAIDTLRGRRGTFLPIPDVEVSRATALEAHAYEEFRRFYQRQWGRVDPVAIRLRHAVDKDAAGKPSEERLDLAIDILPFAREPYAWLQAFAGPPRTRSMAPFKDEALSGEIEFRLFVDGPPAWARFGILDHEPALVFDAGRLDLERLSSLEPLYLVAPMKRSSDGPIEVPILGRSALPEEGLFKYDFGGWPGVLWAAPAGESFTVLAERRDTARRLAAELKPAEGVSAQARMRVAHLAPLRLARALAVIHHHSLRRASASGAELLSFLHRDLKVPLDDCAAAVERILAMAPACPAGGAYQGRPFPAGGGPTFWSDKLRLGPLDPKSLREESEKRGDDYLSAFRGLDIGIRLSGQSLHSEATLRLAPED